MHRVGYCDSRTFGSTMIFMYVHTNNSAAIVNCSVFCMTTDVTKSAGPSQWLNLFILICFFFFSLSFGFLTCNYADQNATDLVLSYSSSKHALIESRECSRNAGVASCSIESGAM